MSENILQVKNLKTYFNVEAGVLKAVDDVSFIVKKNQTLGIIGESGCGKSVTAHSILRTIQKPGKTIQGEILYEWEGKMIDLTEYATDSITMRRIRGKDISMIFQEPMASFSPVYTIGEQLMEAVMVHQEKKDKKIARERSLEMLRLVHMPNPEQQMKNYPHQMSGGMCQRAMIAMAMINHPRILIADEPITALDVTVQAQITDLMKKFQQDFEMSIIYISHDMGVIAEMADSVAVMYLGRVVESGSVFDIFNHPMHPYTKGLLKSMPVLGRKSAARLHAIAGNVPIPLNTLEQCGFRTRCLEASKLCGDGIPPMIEVEPEHFVRCFRCEEEGVI